MLGDVFATAIAEIKQTTFDLGDPKEKEIVLVESEKDEKMVIGIMKVNSEVIGLNYDVNPEPISTTLYHPIPNKHNLSSYPHINSYPHFIPSSLYPHSKPYPYPIIQPIPPYPNTAYHPSPMPQCPNAPIAIPNTLYPHSRPNPYPHFLPPYPNTYPRAYHPSPHAPMPQCPHRYTQYPPNQMANTGRSHM
ncbi:protein TRACHEARY ELEMENT DIFFERENTIATION-RELATED 7A-like [Penaeus japonicus]|uniref:protein TRACHEARY ELEMENT DIFFERENTIATION-RELATED 7A-like n=1 Tax=Penaeus japonicus TaxID=27405 RepID=UPI001C7107FA|nr:protein TRACHEARY ELEMENT DIFFERENTIATION-RELATED 7A-like [Penaeus japonicus]